MSQHFDKTIKTAFALQTNQYMFDLDSPFSTKKTALFSAVFCFGEVDPYPTLTPFAVLRELRTQTR